MSEIIPFLKPHVVEFSAYEKYVRQAEASHIYSNFGPINSAFESRVVEEVFAGNGYGTTVCNATIGLMVALRAMARQSGKYVVMPSYTFAATPLSAIWAGFEPYFIDVDSRSWISGNEIIREALETLQDSVAAILPYATFGSAMELSGVEEWHAAGIPVIIDAAASFGSRCSDTAFGAGFSGCVVFSFHATKAFAIGEGGYVYSGNAEVLSRIRNACNFGFGEMRQAETIGLNAKLPEYAAGIAHATLDRLEEIRSERIRIYSRYLDLMHEAKLFDCGWQVQQLLGDVPHQFMPVLCPPRISGRSAAGALGKMGIQARTYFSPACHAQPAFKSCRHGSLSHTEDIARRSLSLPLWEGMSESELNRVVEGMQKCYEF